MFPVAKTNSCGRYLQDRQKNSRNENAAYGAEFRVFVSGFNMSTSGRSVTKMPEPDTSLAFMDKFCREHPLSDTLEGMAALTVALGGRS